MLVDSDVSLPRDEYAMKLAAEKRAAGGGTGSGTGGGAKCTLMVLVSRAENLPLVRSQ